VYHLSMQYGANAAFSGFVIGANQSFNIVGVILTFTCGIGSISFRTVFFCSMLFFPLMSAMYVSSALAPTNATACCLLFAARSIQGVVRGILECRVYRMFTDAVPRHELRSISMGWALSIALGTGLGPILSSISLNYLAVYFPKELRYVVPMIMMCALHISALPVYYFLVPTSAALAECERALEVQQKEETNARRGSIGRSAQVGALYILIGTCFVLSLLLGALESATSMILETQYQWNNSSTGFVVGLCMLCYVPLHLAVDFGTSPRHQPLLLRVGLIASFFLAFLLLPEFCGLFDEYTPLAASGTSWGCAVFIIGSDAVVWPLVQMCQGIVTGSALELVGPEEVDSTSQLITTAVTITYFVSSPLSRILLETQGVRSYAMLQIALCVIAIVLVEVAKCFSHTGGHMLPEAPSRLSLTGASSSSSPGGPAVHL